tara:strand:+ start:267 stop:452 length:186 start_codon:yes stop_codon:yes gene_type:complete
MMKSILFGQLVAPMIRHGATLIGGYLIAEGYADENTTNEIVGGFVALGGVVWSFVDKKIRA